jgi:hypothetical protein
MIGLLNIVITLLNKINDGDHDKYHMYDTIPGYILIGFRCFFMIIYIIGIAICYSNAHKKKKTFVATLGGVGVFYILSLPIFVYVTEVFIHVNVQK